MIFVSYSHEDKEWLDVFLKMSKPLAKYAEIKVWSDRDIKPGERWANEIEKAMEGATVAVLLVSANFLASDFISDKELPFIFKAHEEGKVHLLWMPISPCQYKHTPLRGLNAVIDPKTPLMSMGTFARQSAFSTLCDKIDDILKAAETPVMNTALAGRAYHLKEHYLDLLLKPATRETEVLVYSAGKWYKQTRIKKGAKGTDCWFGNEKTKAGEEFKVVALTTYPGEHLTNREGYSSLPDYRTKSAEITVKRAA